MRRTPTPKELRNKKLIVFDLDGTLAESKSRMDREMAGLLRRLLQKKRVAVISGGKFELFKRQFVSVLSAPPRLLKNLYLFPTTSTSFYTYGKKNGRNGWRRIYAHNLTKEEKAAIRRAFREVFAKIGYEHPRRTYGTLIEDRGTQMSFSALGQKAPVAAKKAWRDAHTPVKLNIARLVQKRLPRLTVRAAGYTTIDVTEKGIDKAYGIRQIRDHVRIPVRDMVFVGDALFPGGNDYAAVQTGILCVHVTGPRDTKAFIRTLLA